MKKKLIAIIASILVLSLLAGCGSEVKGRSIEQVVPPMGEPQVTVTEQAAEAPDEAQAEPAAEPARGDTCSDSDGGINKDQKGITRGTIDGEAFRETDVCFDSKTLAETYCEGDQLALKYIKCQGECVFGECH